MFYKTGDRFRIVNNHPGNKGYYEGKIGTVLAYNGLNADGRRSYQVQFDGQETLIRYSWNDDGDMEPLKDNKESMKYYRVTEDTPLWGKGAVVQSNGSGYRAVDELYNVIDDMTEYLSGNIVESKENERFFERVYKVDLVTHSVYKLKEEAKEILSKGFKE